jgi:hypothetical protein
MARLAPQPPQNLSSGPAALEQFGQVREMVLSKLGMSSIEEHGFRHSRGVAKPT